jgi:hypothetical protein
VFGVSIGSLESKDVLHLPDKLGEIASAIRFTPSVPDDCAKDCLQHHPGSGDAGCRVLLKS